MEQSFYILEYKNTVREYDGGKRDFLFISVHSHHVYIVLYYERWLYDGMLLHCNPIQQQTVCRFIGMYLLEIRSPTSVTRFSLGGFISWFCSGGPWTKCGDVVRCKRNRIFRNFLRAVWWSSQYNYGGSCSGGIRMKTISADTTFSPLYDYYYSLIMLLRLKFYFTGHR